MKKLGIIALLCLVGGGLAGCPNNNDSAAPAPAPATPAAAVTFQATDSAGSWFECSNSSSTASIGCVPESIGGLGQKSFAIIAPGESIGFASMGQAETLHTAVSLMFPTGAASMPFDTDLVPPKLGGSISPFKVTLTNPGLYVFFCDIHPYMFAAVIVDDPATPEFDLGKTVDLPHVSPGGIAASPNGVQGLPTASNLVLRLVHTFFIATNPHNWQSYAASGTAPWSPTYPPVPVLASADGTTTVSVPDLNAFLQGAFGEPKTLAAIAHPLIPGVGQVWVDTQFETIQEKSKPGTATAVNATTFAVTRKVALPVTNMNNPHNMWTDKDQTVIYQTEWFDNNLSVFNVSDGSFVRRIDAGPAPAHVMTRTNNDQVHVSQNGSNNIRELNSLAGLNSFIRDIPMGPRGENTHPHAHWMSADGSMMVTPNEDSENSTLYSFNLGAIASTTPAGHSPIATGMMPDSSKYYVANFLDSTLSVIGITGFPSAPTATLLKTINLLGDYNPVTGTVTTPVGALPIQTPVSPDGRFVITANTLTASILVIDTTTDTVVAMLPCDAGCHGVQWGAKGKVGGGTGEGYYAYVSSKFSNRMLVVDPDPNGFGVGVDNGSNAVIAGSVLLTGTGAPSDGTVIANAGMGGQGVLPIPVVYNGWVQNLPAGFKALLSVKQQTATK